MKLTIDGVRGEERWGGRRTNERYRTRLLRLLGVPFGNRTHRPLTRHKPLPHNILWPLPHPGTVRSMAERWYEEGLPFGCTACGNCCRSHGEYSHVYLRPEEVPPIADHLGLDAATLVRDHLVVDDGWITLKPDLPACQFLDEDGRCGIYPVRPIQCRTWPFWEINLDRKVWEGEVNAICPGSRSGPVHDPDRIDAIARATEDWYEDRIDEWPGLHPGDGPAREDPAREDPARQDPA